MFMAIKVIPLKRIAIYTNGTIIPKEHQLECLKNDKVIFMITDYSGCGDGEAPNQKTERLGRFKTSVRLEPFAFPSSSRLITVPSPSSNSIQSYSGAISYSASLES